MDPSNLVLGTETVSAKQVLQVSVVKTVGGGGSGGTVDQGSAGLSPWLFALPTGASTSAKQDTGNTSLSSIDGKTPSLGQALAAASVPVVLTAAQISTLTPLSTVTANIGSTNGLALDASINGILLFQGSTTSGQLGPLVQTATTTNAPSYTTAKTNPLSTDTSGLLRISLKDTPQNTNKFLVTADAITFASAQPVTQSGSWSLASNQSINISQINAVTPLMGNGVTGTGSLRVTIASDNTAFPVNATLSAETTKVIGTINIASAQTLATVTTVSTVTAVTAISNALPAGTNVLGYSLAAATSSSTNLPSRISSSALEASHVIKASAGTLYTITGYNSKTSAQFIQVFNSTTVPADTTVPIYTFTVPASSNFSLEFGTLGEAFSTGIAISNSSTAATKTIGSADCFFSVRYA